jgi:hypothetical protein
VEQLKLNCDFRSQLATGEADITAERAQLLVEADTCSYLPTNSHIAPGGSNTGAAPRSSNGVPDN